jgi:endonuclease YncB( thermonuclease family)
MTRYLALALLTVAATPAAAAVLSGIGRPIDGDSLMVGQQEVRLFGIDAPEFTQTCTRAGLPWACGSAAADQLSKLVAGKHVSCVSMGTDQYGRTLARCTAGVTDVNRVMVATGYALAFRRYSMDYISAEESAKAGKRGIWSGTFQLPSDVRHGDDGHQFATPKVERQAQSERPVVSSIRSKPQLSGSCSIKGNRSRRGDWIYHLPGMPYYTQTVAEEIFCTEAEARAAGYRRSRADRQQ